MTGHDPPEYPRKDAFELKWMQANRASVVNAFLL
jgi:hypothetical protein